MFEQPGEKLKKFAAIFFVIEAIGAVVGGIAIAFLDEEFVIWGILTIFAGIAVAYFTALFIAAFGELTESNSSIAQSNQKILQLIKNDTFSSSNEKSQPLTHSNTKQSPSSHDIFAKAHSNTASTVKRCPFCGDIVKNGRCDMCGKEVQ